ncbi:atrial natriuretic peptide receptor 1 isoform X1 [Esox lucius]|uniref:atrial natriuretic peptide receptor 1 isoform X1 n=1 Tax=Esox lucius TaxID=8010 RepID=UPI0014770934|nr:atrial natriuretic peptide receptor 1 isoform X1 [Esox lucius]XP_019899343.2 atrial natriuretic peptide receptor 1 isoform X1 [Esox lucius]XP_028974188.2 atrial natriuretic peptide receptor 1 isoform X1 [Esox lucius]
MELLTVLALPFLLSLEPCVEGSTFTLLLSLPNTSLPFSVGRIGAGALIAIDTVNRSPNLLAGHSLEYEYVDDECSDVNGTGKIMELWHKHNYSAFIGPACSNVCAIVSKLAAFWNVPVVSPTCADQQFLMKKDYPTLTRVFGPFTKMGWFFVKICENFGWRRISIICDNHPAWIMPADGIRHQAEDNNITVAKYLMIEKPLTSLTQAHTLLEITEVSRIIVISAHAEVVRSFLIEADRRGLTTGDYIFVCFDFYNLENMFGNFNWKIGHDDDAVAKQAYGALFLLSLYKPDDQRYWNFSSNVIRRSREDFGYVYAPDEKVSVLAAFAHDSVLLYAQALNETLAEHGDPYDGLAITQKMWNRTIPGIQGDVTMDSCGDRESAYMMKHLQDGEFKVIANYFGTNKAYESVNEIYWPGGRKMPPKDTPDCGFKNELCTNIERRFAVAVGTIAVLLATGTLIVCLLYRKHIIQKKVSVILWRLSPGDVTMMDHSSTSTGKVLYINSMSIHASLESGLENTTDKPSTHRTAIYKENICSVRLLNVKSVCLNRELLAELKRCRDLNHPNICSFIGACLEPPIFFLLTEYCPKGSLQVTHPRLCTLMNLLSLLLQSIARAINSTATPKLQDILKNASIKLDWSFKYSLMLDIVKGMDYLHRSPLRSHGHLSSSNCVVDSRFVLKVTDYGLSPLRRPPFQDDEGRCGSRDHWTSLLWRAPELLRDSMPPAGTQKGDVYSFGVIVQEVVYRQGPFYIPNSTLNAHDIVERVKAGCSIRDTPLRPYTAGAECPEGLEALLGACWSERPSDRPDFSSLRVTVKRLCPSGMKENILDDLLSRLEQYATNLEEVVGERTAQLVEEKRRAEGLLTQMLPRSVAGQLIAGKTVQAETYDCVTIYFSDIEGFTALSASLTPMQVVNMLNDLYTFFDNIIDNYNVYKVETIGDAYMVVSGLPIRNGDDHAKEIARMSLAVVRGMRQYNSPYVPQQLLKVRIGLHSGPCVAGVVGLKMPRYCLFGDTVNTASRMESYGSPLQIHVSSSTKALLDTFGMFCCELRGDIHMKGKGLVRTFWLLGEDQ